MAVGFALLVLFLGCVAGVPYGQLYPQPANPLPIEVAELVHPKYGATVAVGKPTAEIEQLGDFPAFYIVGGSKTVPDNFPYITNDFSDVELDQDLYVYYYELGYRTYFSKHVNSVSWMRKEWPAAPRARIFGNSWEYEGYIYVFGGGAPGVDRFFIDGNYWEALPDFGAAHPAVRYGATSVQVDNLVYVFGGVDKASGETLNDFWVFNVETYEWTRLPSFPTGRAASSFFAFAGSLYLFGGQGASQQPLNDMWKYDITTASWTFVSYENNGPAGRWGHFAFSTPVSCLFGVTLGYAEDYSNVWYYDVSTNVWTVDEFGREDSSPAAMVGYSAVEFGWYGEAFGYIFGGASDDWEPRPSSPSAWSRDFALFGDVWSFDGYEFFREGCYPGYKWSNTVCVLDVSEEVECDTEDLVRRTYVQEIEEKLITKQYSGFLRQCPSFWRESVYKYANWFSLSS